MVAAPTGFRGHVSRYRGWFLLCLLVVSLTASARPPQNAAAILNGVVRQCQGTSNMPARFTRGFPTKKAGFGSCSGWVSAFFAYCFSGVR
jgi:hypothetical protein